MFVDPKIERYIVSLVQSSRAADAFGLKGICVTKRSEVQQAVQTAREDPGTVVIDFRVEQEDTVFPMVPAGADLNAMIRRPKPVVVDAPAEVEW